MNRVVIIEDQVSIRELTAQFIGKIPGYEIAGMFGNADEGIARSRVLRPDIVVLDLGLPDRSGLEVLSALIADAPTVKVLIFSGRGAPGGMREAIAGGAAGYIDKMDAVAQFAQALGVIAAGGTFIGSNMTAAMRTTFRDPSDSPRTKPLSPRETQILQLVAEGLSTREMAGRLNLSPRTVDNHRTKVMAKLNLHNVAALTRYAVTEELVPAC